VVTVTLSDLLRERPVNRAAVQAHKKRMRAEMRANRLREIREALSLTQVEMAKRLRVSQNRVSQLQQGDLDRTQVDTLRRYAEALGGDLKVELEFEGERVELS
jgi:transcriptional regulator with XRE-family HTH domain